MPHGNAKKRSKRAEKRNKKLKNKAEQKLPTYVVAFGIQEVCDDPNLNNEANTSNKHNTTHPKIPKSPEISNFTPSDTSVATQRENSLNDKIEICISDEPDDKPEFETSENIFKEQSDSLNSEKIEKPDKITVSEFIKEYTGLEPEIVFDGYKRKKAKKLTSKYTKKSKVLVDKKIRNVNLRNHKNRIKRQIKMFYGKTINLRMQHNTASLTNIVSRQSILKKVCAKENLLDYMVGDENNIYYKTSKSHRPVKNKSLLNLSGQNQVILQSTDATLYFQDHVKRQNSMTEIVVVPNRTVSTNLLTSVEAQKIMSIIVALSEDNTDKADGNYINCKTANTSSHFASPKSLLHLADWACHTPKFCGCISSTKTRQETNDQETRSLDARDALSKGDFGDIGQILTDNPNTTSNTTVQLSKEEGNDDNESTDNSEASNATLVQKSTFKNNTEDIVAKNEVQVETVMPSNASTFMKSESFGSDATLTQKNPCLVSNDLICRSSLKFGSGKNSFQFNSYNSESYFKILSDGSSQPLSEGDKGKSGEDMSLSDMHEYTTTSDTATDVETIPRRDTFKDAFHADTKNFYDQNIALVQTSSPTVTLNPNAYETLYCPGTLTNLLTSFIPEEVTSTPADSERYVSTITTKLDSELTESSNLPSEGSYFTSSEMYTSDSENLTSMLTSELPVSTVSESELMATGALIYSEQFHVTDTENYMAAENLTYSDTISQKTVTPWDVSTSRMQTNKRADTPRYIDSDNYFKPTPRDDITHERSPNLPEPLLYSISNSKAFPQPLDGGMLIRREIIKNELKIKTGLEKSKTKPSKIAIDKAAKDLLEKVSKLPSEALTKFLSSLQAKPYLSQTNQSTNEEYVTGNTWRMSSETLVANDSRTRTVKYTSLETRNSVAEETFIKSNTYSHKTKTDSDKTSKQTAEIDTSLEMKMTYTDDSNEIKSNQRKECKDLSRSSKKEGDWQMVFDIIDIMIRKLEDNLVVRLIKELEVHMEGAPDKLKESQIETSTQAQQPEVLHVFSGETKRTSQEAKQDEPKTPMFPQSIQCQCNLLNNNEINNLMHEIEKKYEKKAQEQAADATKNIPKNKAFVKISFDEDLTKNERVQDPGVTTKSTFDDRYLAEILENEIKRKYEKITPDKGVVSKSTFSVKSPVEINLEAALKCRQNEPILSLPSRLECESLIDIEKDERAIIMNSPTAANVCVRNRNPPRMLKPLWFIKENWFIITWVPFFYIICMFVVYGAFSIFVHFCG